MPKKKIVNKRKPTAKDWDVVRRLYLREEELDYIIEQLPDVQITKEQIMKKVSAEGLPARRRAIREKAIEATEAKALVEIEKVNDMCINLFNKGADIIDDLLKNYADELKEGNVSKGQARATAYNIDMLMSGLTKIQKGLRVSYDADDKGKLYEKQPEVMVIEGFDNNKI